jgi:hypothetical protein
MPSVSKKLAMNEITSVSGAGAKLEASRTAARCRLTVIVQNRK